MTWSQSLIMVFWAGAGAGLALVYFHLLGRSVAALRGAASPWGAGAYAALRLLLAAAGFVLAARQGAGPLLLAFAGFVLVRLLVLRTVHQTYGAHES